MTRRSLLLSMGTAAFTSVGELAAAETRSEKTILIGDTRVRLVILEIRMRGKRGLTYFHPHENEHGSAVVTRHVIQQLGGKLIEIRSAGERQINFRLKGKTFSFDPNRMFTDLGLSHSLTHYGPTSEPALESARKLRTAVLAEFDNGKTPLIAVHNNAEDGLNVTSFRPHGPMSNFASDVAINPVESGHNFFLVLDDRLFSRLHHAGFNTVLEAPDRPDDGSLSVYCQQHHWRYVNVEAAETEMSEQERMLKLLPAALA